MAVLTKATGTGRIPKVTLSSPTRRQHITKATMADKTVLMVTMEIAWKVNTGQSGHPSIMVEDTIATTTTTEEAEAITTTTEAEAEALTSAAEVEMATDTEGHLSHKQLSLLTV